MASRLSGNLEIQPRDIAIGFLPLIVGLVGGRILDRMGRTTGAFDLMMVANSHLEAAARLKMLATWVLANAIALSAIAYFAWTVRLFGRKSQAMLLAAYVGVAVIGLIVVWQKAGGNSEVLMTRPALCAPLRLVDAGRSDDRTTLHVSPGAHWPQNREPAYAVACSESPSFKMLQSVNDWQRYLLALVLPALVLGAISCLPRHSGDESRQTDDIERLKVWLYLAAANFVSGLLYMSALLRWPGYAYEGAASVAYNAHVSGYVLYLGVSFTIFIAAYYLPIYIRLVSRLDASPRTDLGRPIQPLDLTKLALSAFAPAIAGLLGDVLAL